jgi:hypothetical protein
MNTFVRVVAVVTVAAALATWYFGAGLRAGLGVVLGVALWIAAARPVRRPVILAAAAALALVVVAIMLLGAFGIVFGGAIDAR